MPLYEIDGDQLVGHEPASFAGLGIRERWDLQRVLRDNASALGEDLLVVAEEFGGWLDARRRIDLLAVDRAGRLVVIELKRSEDAGHSELQALRYAAMVAPMTFEQLTETYGAYLARRHGLAVDDAIGLAEEKLVAFFDAADGPETFGTAGPVRIVLVAADFGRELTTSVLWLWRTYGVDIRCVRLVPYEVDGRVLLDIQQVIPLPEAADYEVRLRRQNAERERAEPTGRDFTRYHVVVDGADLPDTNKRNTVRVMVEQLLARGASMRDLVELLPPRKLKGLDGVHHDPEEVAAALLAADSRVDVRRFFCDHPIHVGRNTFVLSKMWGRDTEPTLGKLAGAFPEAGVTYRIKEG